ncbi:BTB/POZ domain-containing protein [Paraphaeosphaeria sporulosa]
MIRFFYKMDYDGDLPEGEIQSNLQLHARMFALGDQYDIAGVCASAEAKYWQMCIKAWDPLDFLSSVPVIYESTPTSVLGLRKTACNAVRKYLPTMLDNTDTAECFEETISENPAFATDLLRSYINNPLFGYCRVCRLDCGMDPLQTRCQKCNKGQSSSQTHWDMAW